MSITRILFRLDQEVAWPPSPHILQPCDQHREPTVSKAISAAATAAAMPVCIDMKIASITIAVKVATKLPSEFKGAHEAVPANLECLKAGMAI